ncbi:MAG: hypothetical protein QM759_02845 [Terricaulis sp.]
MPHKIRKLAAWVLCASTLAACATPITYGALSAGNGYGYRDTHNADGSYTILVVAPNDAMAREFWDKRAQELCGGTDFHKNIFRAEVPVVMSQGYAPSAYPGGYGGSYTSWAHGAFNMEGYLHCNAVANDATPAQVSDQAAPATPAANATTPPSAATP